LQQELVGWRFKLNWPVLGHTDHAAKDTTKGLLKPGMGITATTPVQIYRTKESVNALGALPEGLRWQHDRSYITRLQGNTV